MLVVIERLNTQILFLARCGSSSSIASASAPISFQIFISFELVCQLWFWFVNLIFHQVLVQNASNLYQIVYTFESWKELDKMLDILSARLSSLRRIKLISYGELQKCVHFVDFEKDCRWGVQLQKYQECLESSLTFVKTSLHLRFILTLFFFWIPSQPR